MEIYLLMWVASTIFAFGATLVLAAFYYFYLFIQSKRGVVAGDSLLEQSLFNFIDGDNTDDVDGLIEEYSPFVGSLVVHRVTNRLGVVLSEAEEEDTFIVCFSNSPLGIPLEKSSVDILNYEDWMSRKFANEEFKPMVVERSHRILLGGGSLGALITLDDVRESIIDEINSLEEVELW